MGSQVWAQPQVSELQGVIICHSSLAHRISPGAGVGAAMEGDRLRLAWLEGSALVVNLSCSRPRPAVLTTVMGNRDGLGPAGCVCVCGLGGVGLGQTPGSPPSTGVQRWPWAAARVPWLDAVGLGSVISFDATQP